MDIICVPVGPLQANCYLVFDETRSACAIDPGGEPERVAAIIRREELTLRAVLVTHAHFDHIEGVRGLAEATGAPVYCSGLAKSVVTGQQDCSATGWPVPCLDEASVHVVEDGSELTVGTLRVRVIGTPGHTPGDLTFEIGGHLFPGDLLFYRSVGRTDFPGGDFGQLLASIAKLAGRYPAATRVHPGHMQSTTLGDELAANPFLGGLETGG